MNDGYSTGRLPKNKLKVIFITILTTYLAKSVKIENSSLADPNKIKVTV